MRATWLAFALGSPGSCLATCLPAAASAQAGAHPVVAELFTSEGCSSCPPADALITALARTRPELLLLTFHVTYWNGPGWRDLFSFPGATERQRNDVALGAARRVAAPS